MVESNKKPIKKVASKVAPQKINSEVKKVKVAEKPTIKEEKPIDTALVEEVGVTPLEPTECKKKGSSAQAVIIAILLTLVICMVATFTALLMTGVIKFNGDSVEKSGDNTLQAGNLNKDGAPVDAERIINNPNPRVEVNGNLASVKDLEFYLPDNFEESKKNKDGAYTYNLVDDDGWAQVLVYAERSNLTPEDFLLDISQYLEITDDDYEMNGTSWVQAENANSLAYATELDGTIYAVYYNVKLDSDATSKAMQMIPKTLYMKRIYNPAINK